MATVNEPVGMNSQNATVILPSISIRQRDLYAFGTCAPAPQSFARAHILASALMLACEKSVHAKANPNMLRMAAHTRPVAFLLGRVSFNNILYVVFFRVPGHQAQCK